MRLVPSHYPALWEGAAGAGWQGTQTHRAERQAGPREQLPFSVYIIGLPPEVRHL